MRHLFSILCIVILTVTKAQQSAKYTQYSFNAIGSNPAYAGSTPNKVEAIFGRRNQWYGFDNAPTTMFFSACYGYRGNYSYKGWHGFSTYVENDKVGALTNKSAYLGYAYHFRIITGINMAFGLQVGVRSFGISNSLYSANDPAFANLKSTFYAYPDFIPGMRIYSKRMFFDLSVRQLYKNKMEQGKHQIGTDKAKLPPHYTITYGRKIHLGYNDFVLVPSVRLQSALLNLPQADANIMVYYKKRIGAGMNYRVGNSFSGILQVNLRKNIVVGFSYDYTANRFRNAAANTYEFMIGLSPMMTDETNTNRRSVAQCPTFDF